MERPVAWNGQRLKTREWGGQATYIAMLVIYEYQNEMCTTNHHIQVTATE